MARFMGTVQGSRGEASRLGGENSGVRTSANGWDIGVDVRGFVDQDGDDVFHVYATGGSGRRRNSKLLAIVTAENFDDLKDMNRQ